MDAMACTPPVAAGLTAHRDIPGWFPEENERELSRLIAEHGIRSVIEVGSFVGKSAVFFAQRVDHVLCVDTFRGTGEHYLTTVPALVARMRAHFDRNTAPYANIRALAMRSEDAAEHCLPADLIYLDAGHRYAEVVRDIGAWRPLALRVLCGDDYHWPEVREAVDRCIPGVQTSGRLWWTLIGGAHGPG